MKEYRFEKLTWEELDAASDENRVCIIPVGTIEQHGPHLAVDLDVVCPTEVALAAGKRMPEKIFVLPPVSYGYTAHVMDFPGTINIHHEHFINYVLDICKSLAYHGYKKLMLLNGHGSNMPNLDLVMRRCILETDAECVFAAWWQLLEVDRAFLKGWRESKFPGGCEHACELETSVYWFLRPQDVRTDKIKSKYDTTNEKGSRFRWADLFAASPIKSRQWTSTFSETGAMGDCEKGTRAKGEIAFNEAVNRLCEFVDEWRSGKAPVRHDRHAKKPTMPMPWNQHDSLPYPEHGGGR